MFAASLLSRFMNDPSHIHLGATKRMLRYIQGTLDCEIKYENNVETNLFGFCDSDWAGSIDDVKSTSGYVFSLGSGAFSWCSKKQQTVAQSSVDEYISAGLATQQAIWLKKILNDFGEKQEAVTIHCDNKSAIAIAKNPVHHGRTKHIAIRHHFIREAIENEEVQLNFCKTNNQVADIFTKALKHDDFKRLRGILGVQKTSLWGNIGNNIGFSGNN